MTAARLDGQAVAKRILAIRYGLPLRADAGAIERALHGPRPCAVSAVAGRRVLPGDPVPYPLRVFIPWV